MFKKTLLTTIISLLVLPLFLTPPPTLASTAIRDNPEMVENSNSEGLNFDKGVSQQVDSTFSAFGQAIMPFGTSLSESNDEGLNRSAVFSIAKIIDHTLYTAPVSSQEYIADVIHNLNPASPVYAQGLGFSGLYPVLKIWKAFRDMVYFLFVIVFVIIGFMIMFRAKINPQTVVNVQQALPKIIFTLILVTFSYAIAGFIIDAIYYSIYLAANLFEFGNLIVSGKAAAQELLSRSVTFLGWRYLMGPTDAAGTSSRAVGEIVQGLLHKVPILQGYGSGLFVSALAYLIIALAILINLVRALFTLIKAYIGIILAVIFAPFQIMFNAFPGSQAFMVWLRGLLANAAVFPATAVMVLLGMVLVGSSNNTGPAEQNIQVVPGVGYSGTGIWRPNQSPVGFVPPLVIPGNTGTADALQAIIGLGIIMLIPEVLQIVQATLKIEDKLGALAMQNLQRGSKPVFGTIAAPFKWGGRIAGQVITQTGANILSDELAQRIPFLRNRGEKATEHRIQQEEAARSKYYKNKPNPYTGRGYNRPATNNEEGDAIDSL